MSQTERECKSCQKPKPLKDFHRHGFRYDGTVKHSARCRPCVSRERHGHYEKRKADAGSKRDFSMQDISPPKLAQFRGFQPIGVEAAYD